MSHEAQISRINPTAFLFVVDQSGSMSDRMSIGKSKAEFVSDALNRTLMNLIGRCTKSEGVRDYFEVVRDLTSRHRVCSTRSPRLSRTRLGSKIARKGWTTARAASWRPL